MSWAATELESIDLGDPRRNRRAIRLIERLSAKPTASVQHLSRAGRRLPQEDSNQAPGP